MKRHEYFLSFYFSWLTPLLQLGQKRRLEENDMYSILKEDQSEALGEELQRYYTAVLHYWITNKSQI